MIIKKVKKWLKAHFLIFTPTPSSPRFRTNWERRVEKKKKGNKRCILSIKNFIYQFFTLYFSFPLFSAFDRWDFRTLFEEELGRLDPRECETDPSLQALYLSQKRWFLHPRDIAVFPPTTDAHYTSIQFHFGPQMESSFLDRTTRTTLEISCPFYEHKKRLKRYREHKISFDSLVGIDPRANPIFNRIVKIGGRFIQAVSEFNATVSGDGKFYFSSMTPIFSPQTYTDFENHLTTLIRDHSQDPEIQNVLMHTLAPRDIEEENIGSKDFRTQNEDWEMSDFDSDSDTYIL